MTYETTDWFKFMKVFNLNVDVQVKKEVTRHDILLSLLDENEIAFKGKSGHTILKLNKDNYKFAKELIINELEQEYKQSLEDKKQ